MQLFIKKKKKKNIYTLDISAEHEQVDDAV